MTTDSTPIPPAFLAGPDGGTLLGFLCAAGTLVGLQRAFLKETVRVSWVSIGGWRPRVLIGERLFTQADVSALFLQLKCKKNRERFRIKANHRLKEVKSLAGDGCYLNPDAISSTDYAAAAIALRQRERLTSRSRLDFLAAIGCQLDTSETSAVEATALCALGSSQQYFFKAARQLSQTPGEPISEKGKGRPPRSLEEDPGTAPEHLTAALFSPWSYSHPPPGMRWDSAEDRNHALRWRDPSPDAIWTERGANRLAIEALQLLPTAQSVRGMQTCAFSEQERRDYFSWPIWNVPLSVDAVKTLLSYAELTRRNPRRARLEPLGVVEIFRSERLRKDRQVNFSVARPVLE
jgi:hypothetical protein